MLVFMTFTLMQGHSGSAKAKNQHCMVSTTKQAITVILATTVGPFLHEPEFANGLTVVLFLLSPDLVNTYLVRSSEGNKYHLHTYVCLET